MRLGMLGLAAVLLVLPMCARAMEGTTDEIDVTNATKIGIVDPLKPTKGGTGANNTATSGRYLRGDGTNFVTSSVAAAGAGTCTNQFVRATVDNAAPTCATVSLTADVTGTLPAANGGLGIDSSSATDDQVLVNNGSVWQLKTLTTCTGSGKAVTYDAATNAWGCNTITAGLNPFFSFSTLGDLTGGQTAYMAPGAVDPSQSRAQQIAPEGFSADDLNCVSSAAPGASNTFIITMADGACTGALTDSTQQVCTISGTNRTCAEAGSAEAVTSGQCYAWSVVSLDGDTATAVISCTARRTA